MSGILDTLKGDPTELLNRDPQDILQLIKTIFDPISKGNSVLDEIYVDGLNASQVWPQAKIILDNVTDSLLFEKIPNLKPEVLEEEASESAEGEQLEDQESGDEDDDSQNEVEQEETESDVSDSETELRGEDGELVDDFEDEDVEEEEDEKEDDKGEEGEAPAGGESEDKDALGLNDGFFSLDDFNKQIIAQENEDNEDDGINYFEDIPDSDDEEVLYHNDFFDKKQSSNNSFKDRKKPAKKVEFANEENEEGDFNEDDFDHGMESAMQDLFDDAPAPVEEPSTENLSSFEKQQLLIQQEISKLEREAIAEKKWALKGESKAKDRPAHSLLEEDLEFERTAKPVPVITAEVTESLEDLIRRRIKEDNFDDLPRRVITDVTNFKASQPFELSETKSSKSLAEEYEADYQAEQDEVSEELQKAHDEIKLMFQSISHKLDSLSSAHFIPKPAQKSIDIKVNAPSITMEDSQPLTLSNSSTLAPQEIFRAERSRKGEEITLKSGVTFSKEELSRDEKQRLRRANKRKRSKEFKEKDSQNVKKSKKQDVIDTLSKANNVTIINDKGEKRDVRGELKKDKAKQGSTTLKL